MRQHPDCRLLSGLPGFGPVHGGQLLAPVGTPPRFRSKRQFWPYCGLAVVTRSSADYQIAAGQIIKSQQQVATRGLHRNHNPRLKQVFKSAALTSLRDEECQAYYQRLGEDGTRPEWARVWVARPLAAAALALWQRQEAYDAQKFFAPAGVVRAPERSWSGLYQAALRKAAGLGAAQARASLHPNVQSRESLGPR